MPTTVALVSCGKLKRDVPSPARDLYIGALVEKSLKHAERSNQRTFIISAKHGLLFLDQVVEPYNVKLTDLPRKDRMLWGGFVARQLLGVFGYEPLTIACYASSAYAWYIKQRANGMPWTFVQPIPGWEGMPIGKRLQALNQELGSAPYKVGDRVRFPDGSERVCTNTGVGQPRMKKDEP